MLKATILEILGIFERDPGDLLSSWFLEGVEIPVLYWV